MRKEMLENIFNSKRNCIISGDMSTGKTTNLGYGIVQKIIDTNGSLFVLDSREEYLKRYYSLLKEKDYNIIIINIKDAIKSDGWNMFNYPYHLYKNGNKDDAVKYLDNIAKEIFCEYNSNIDPFWMNSASDYFTGITLAMFEDAGRDEINLKSISSIIDDSESNINYIAEYFRTKGKDDLAYICASGTAFSPLETRGGIVSSAKQKLRPIISREKLNYLLNKTTFDYDKILKNKTAIFFINPESDNSLNDLISIFVKELYNILVDNNNLNAFNFVLDNFDTIDNIINFKDVLSSCIYNSIKFYIFTRDKENLEKKYSNYINKVSDNIILFEKEISIEINKTKKNITNQVIKKENNDVNIAYPSLKIDEIKVFNLKKFVLENIKVDNIEE